MSRRYFSLFLISLALLSAPAAAQTSAEQISVHEPWVRLNAPGTQVSAAFMVLRNAGEREIKLTQVDSTIAKASELHNHFHEGGVMKMRQVPAISIPAKGETALKPGSYHLMLIDLKSPLTEGETVAVTLGFADGSRKKVDAKVTRPSAETTHKH